MGRARHFRALTLLIATSTLALPIRAQDLRPVPRDRTLASAIIASDFLINPNGTRVVYIDHTNENVSGDELFSVPVDGSEDAVRLSEVLGPDYIFLTPPRLTPDGERVVYWVYRDSHGGPSLNFTASAPLDGSGPAVDLGVEGPFDVSPDSLWVVSETVSDQLERVPVDGSAAPVTLIPPPVSGSFGTSDLVITPDSSTIVFIQDYDVAGKFELYRVPIAGGTPTKLSGALVAGGRVRDARAFSPDSARVIYLADQEVDERVELYSVALSGGAPVKLNGPLVAGGDVGTAEITPDGSRVVYTADQDTDGVLELYSVPLTGGTAVRLNGTLAAGGDVVALQSLAAFYVTPTGRVVYAADQELDERFELYSVPVAGGPVVDVNGALASGGDVSFFRISLDGERVVYLADQDVDGRNELYSRHVDGSSVAIRLNPPLVAGGAVRDHFALGANDAVYYRADQEIDEQFELFQVAIRGGLAQRASLPPVAGGDVEGGFVVTPDGRTVVYLADQEVDEVFDVHASSPRARAGRL